MVLHFSPALADAWDVKGSPTDPHLSFAIGLLLASVGIVCGVVAFINGRLYLRSVRSGSSLLPSCEITLNNSAFQQTLSRGAIRVGEDCYLVCAVDVPARRIRTALNGTLMPEVLLPGSCQQRARQSAERSRPTDSSHRAALCRAIGIRSTRNPILSTRAGSLDRDHRTHSNREALPA